MVEFNTILESCSGLRITHSFPELGYICVSQLSLTCGVSEVKGLVVSKGVEPMVGDESPQGWMITQGFIML